MAAYPRRTNYKKSTPQFLHPITFTEFSPIYLKQMSTNVRIKIHFKQWDKSNNNIAISKNMKLETAKKQLRCVTESTLFKSSGTDNIF